MLIKNIHIYTQILINAHSLNKKAIALVTQRSPNTFRIGFFFLNSSSKIKRSPSIKEKRL